MTDETKMLFSAPWQIWGDGCQVCDIRGTERAYCEDIKDSARLARLPELYDALIEAVLRTCSTCIGFNLSDTPLDDIGRYCRANCPVHKYTALLKKVRDGE